MNASYSGPVGTNEILHACTGGYVEACKNNHMCMFLPHACPILSAGGDSALEARFGGSYSWEPSNEPSLFPGRQARVMCKGQQVGTFGIVHPEVSEACTRQFSAILVRENMHLDSL